MNGSADDCLQIINQKWAAKLPMPKQIITFHEHQSRFSCHFEKLAAIFPLRARTYRFFELIFLLCFSDGWTQVPIFPCVFFLVVCFYLKGENVLYFIVWRRRKNKKKQKPIVMCAHFNGHAQHHNFIIFFTVFIHSFHS